MGAPILRHINARLKDVSLKTGKSGDESGFRSRLPEEVLL